MPSGFRSLQVWQRTKTLAVAVYHLTGTAPIKSDFGLCDQMRRSAVSICSNIAEGDARQTDKESVQFFFVAKGSLAELSAQIEVAAEVHALPQDDVQRLLRECDEIGAMLQALIDLRRK